MANKTSRKRSIIRSFEAKTLKKRPFHQKVADELTKLFGSIWFLLFNLTVFVTWITINIGKVPSIKVFDPFPFVLLINFVSLEAIVLAVVVLISQNRENQISTLRDELQLQVQIFTEKELTKILYLLKKLLNSNDIRINDDELTQMLEEIDTSYIERKLDEQLNPKQKSIPKRIVQKVEKSIKGNHKAS